jgi:hypothetical protein
LAELAARSFRLTAPAGEELSIPRQAALTPRLEGPRRSDRCTNPLDPRYRVPLSRDLPGTSICCSWSEEASFGSASPPVFVAGEIGYIPGSRPDAKMRDNGQSCCSLESRDILGAAPMRRIGAQPYNMYGPFGKRPECSPNLDTSDIKGAQADTYCRYPKISVRNAERNSASLSQT